MSYTTWVLARRHKRGVKRLDEKRPGWYRRVYTVTLDMASSRDCVLGQVFDDYDTGKRLLGIGHGWYFGFNAGPGRDHYRQYRILDDLWIAEITNRKLADLPVVDTARC